MKKITRSFLTALFLSLICSVLSLNSAFAATGDFTTIAGGQDIGSPLGDGGLATEASLNLPNDVVIDSEGNLYIADTGNNRIRKVDTSGIITTIAGTGVAGYNGDNILAINAQLNSPTYLAIDGEDNLFINDSVNDRIRKINTSGVITTFVGAGTSLPLGQPGGIELDIDGNLYLIDGARVLKVDPSGEFSRFAGSVTAGDSGDGGPAIDATLRPLSLAIDKNGNVLIGGDRREGVADSSGFTLQDSSIRKVDASGTITSIYSHYDKIVSIATDQRGGIQLLRLLS